MRQLLILFLIALFQSCTPNNSKCKRESLGDVFSILQVWDSSTIKGLNGYNDIQPEKIKVYINSLDTTNLKRVEMYHRKSFLLQIQNDSMDLCRSDKDTLCVIEHSSAGERLFRQKYLIVFIEGNATIYEYGYGNDGNWILKGTYHIPGKSLSFMFDLIKNRKENHKEEIDFNSSIFITTYINGEIQVIPFLYSPAEIYSNFVKALQMK